ncbi:MAG: cyclic nucleotide-binding protein [Anaerolineaceae bacterium]|nr:cyclic nucleotide-binding protein [Anaerolineaceae bacterium]
MVSVEHFSNSENTLAFPANSVVFRQGEPGETMYAVQSGQIQIEHDGKTIALLGPGSIFGEMALIDGSPRSATAIAVTNSELVQVDKYHFQFLVHEAPTFATRVMQTLSERLRSADELID